MKTKRILAWLLAIGTAVSCASLAGCSQENQMKYEIPHYQGQLADGQEKSDYNKELFYRNDHKIKDNPDPFILDNTSRDGWYYLYGTNGSLFTYRSKNLMDWEPVGNTLDNLDYEAPGVVSEIRRVTWDAIWAPEVIYDPDDQLYYMFFSATPQTDESVVPGQGVMEGKSSELMMVATSKYPDRDFQLVNFKDPESCGEENLHTYNTTPGLKDENGEYINAYPHYYAKYLFLDPEEFRNFAAAWGGDRSNGYAGYLRAIDPHPHVDENGDKWMFFVDNIQEDRICVVKMENWLKPDWSTAKVVAYYSFYTVEDYQAAAQGQTVELVPYELSTRYTTNEGPHVIMHNGKYYLTLSIGSYVDNSYQLVQAVADHIDGPYRKLTLEEGGLLLSGEIAGSQEVSGPGHHGFITAGDQLLIVYHRHNDVVAAGGPRNPAIDEVKWITIKDKFGNDLDVMYVNGPTVSAQPKIEAFSDYVNIADEATVSGGENVGYLTDGLLSTYKYLNEDFEQYVQETSISKTTTFTFDFEEARTVRAVMVYNSKHEFYAFQKIANMEFVCIEDGKEVIRYIDDVVFSSENFKANDYDGSIYYIVSGAAAYAEFNELNVKSIRITIEVPEGQESVGISEVRILGK